MDGWMDGWMDGDHAVHNSKPSPRNLSIKHAISIHPSIHPSIHLYLVSLPVSVDPPV